MSQAISRHRIYATIALTITLAAVACDGSSSDEESAFGEEPITILVSSSVGSSVDVYARGLANALEEEVSATVSVENLEGGGGEVAMQRLIQSDPDGTTLFAFTQSHAVLFALEQMESITPEDLDYIARLQDDPFVWAVDASSPYKSIADLKDDNLSPSIGGFGAQSSHTFAAYNIGQEMDLDFDWVSFEGGEEAITAVLGGHLDLINTNPGIVRDYQEDGTIRVLAVSAEDEIDTLPGVPTFIEEGVDYTGSNWRGLVAPAGLSDEVREDLASAVNSAFENEAFQEEMVDRGVIPSFISLEEFEEYAMSDIEALSETTSLLDLD